MKKIKVMGNRLLAKGILVLLGLSLLCSVCQAENWTTHFAYNNVVQIAMGSDRVYAISDGSLFSVDTNRENPKIRIYNRQSGLHSTGISCIHYDTKGETLLIAYKNGKIDLLSASGVHYVGDLYNKDMTQRKDIYNVTIFNRTAYLSTHYGVQTFDLDDHKLVDSYWLRPNGQETPIQDVLIQGDSIYAFASDSLYCASLKSNLVDYTIWKRELRSGRIYPDPDKGMRYQDGEDTWCVGGQEGVILYTAADRIPYKPQGPLYNTPYSMTTSGNKLWVVQGGRWSAQFERPGAVMCYDGARWTNINADSIKAVTKNPTLDFVNVAVDPRNSSHYFVTSYGTGLYEFDKGEFVHQYLPGEDNTLVSAVESAPKNYTRLDNAIFDDDNNLWLLDAEDFSQLQCLDTTGTWHAINLEANGRLVTFPTPGGLVIDPFSPDRKWIAVARSNTCICVLDDGSTRFDETDDKLMLRNEWHNQFGNSFQPAQILNMIRDRSGRIWIATDIGVAYFQPNSTDYFLSDAIIQPDLMDDNGENPITNQKFTAICEDANGRIWLGSEKLGVYVLSADADEIVKHYTTENSSMPSNAILSLAKDESGVMYVGTAEGIACYDENALPTIESKWDDEENLDPGLMKRWRLHYSYSNPTEIAATPHSIFANANGALFSVNRKDETISHWNKSTGLNGSAISHIAYDSNSANLVIGYESGMVDLLKDADGTVRQIPDIYIKAGSIPVAINSISIGKKCVYLAMPFGIIAINPQKAEVIDTYYIGENASTVNILQIVELGDSIYAFGENRIYSASLNDNLVDYSYWHKLPVKTDRLQMAAIYHNNIYTLQHDSLYRWKNNAWHLVRPESFTWLHVSNGQLLLCIGQNKLYCLTDDEQLSGLSDRYTINDAIYSNGEYWLGHTNLGLVRLGHNGDDYFRADGPNSNSGYCMYAADGQIYSAVGGRWASEFLRKARINIYNGTSWRGIDETDISSHIGGLTFDPVSIAADPQDAGHFYVATYGTGVIEFRNYEAHKRHTTGNSTLQPVNATIDARFYTRTEGAMMDDQGNLWILNATSIGQPIHILTPDGNWHALSPKIGGKVLTFITPGPIWVDRRNSDYKWMIDQRYTQGVILFYDKGTPTYSGDDHCVKRNSFIDQNQNTITPSYIRCLAQDYSNRIWIGTEKGILLIPANIDFFTSNSCYRIIIPRNDGTGLGDYLLGDEQINCMAVDGGNRMWIGTENSGLYLIEDDTITVAHFTERNSLLPSNSILSIAIEPNTGEVFVGTGKGIASYRSDASESQEKMDSAYAYPNPVPANYGGNISIVGLMDNTVVNIIDAGGNLVCKTKSHGGTAIWDGRTYDGRRATPGIYTALCNSLVGHTVLKIYIVR